jgi:asparagine N-glycosylation enzyme membrane subunit Stt3
MAEKTTTKIYSFISNKRVVIALAVIVGMAFTIRVILPLKNVFGYGYVNFLEGDAYSRMWYATNISNMPLWSGFTYAVENSLLFPWLIGSLGRFLSIELVGVWLPPILAVGVIILVYLIGNELFNSLVGLMAALFVAIIPSEFFHRSLLGYADHHIMEVFLLTLVVFLLIKTMRAKRMRWYIIGTGCAIFFYLANWTGGILLIGIMMLTLAVYYIVGFIQKRWADPKALISLSLPGLIGIALFLGLGGFARYFWWLPGDLVANQAAEFSAGLTGEATASMLAPLSERTTSELMPLLFPLGKFDIRVVLTNMHFFLITFVLGIVYFWKWRRDNINQFILVMTFVFLAITLNQRRFMYYLTLPIGLLSAWGIYELGQKFKKHSQVIMLGITTVLVIFSMPLLQIIGMSGGFAMSPEWHDALVWLKEEPSEGMVTAWSDYGHWIQYTSDKTPNLLPGPGGEDVAQLWLTSDDTLAQELLNDLETEYLIIDKVTLFNKSRALEIIGGQKFEITSLATRLANNVDVSYLRLVYESANIKIYKKGLVD